MEKKFTILSVHIDVKTVEKLREIAVAERRSLSFLTRDLVTQFVESRAKNSAAPQQKA